jgi:hypothetical protein
MNLITKLRLRLELYRLEIAACHDRVHRVERDARKENRPVPAAEMQKLQREIRDANANLDSCEASLAGVLRFPPIAQVAR